MKLSKADAIVVAYASGRHVDIILFEAAPHCIDVSSVTCPAPLRLAHTSECNRRVGFLPVACSYLLVVLHRTLLQVR